MKSRSQALKTSLTLCLLLAPLVGWGQGNGWHYNTGNLLRAVKFVGQEGWAVGSNGMIIHTSDGGEQWELQRSGTVNNLLRLSFPDTNNGWIIGQGDPRFFRTRDGGTTWIAEPPPPGGDQMVSICFIDSLHGWITNGDSVVFTRDGGGTWEGTFTFVGCAGITFLDTLLGWTVSSDQIFKSTNGGRTWTNIANVSWSLYTIQMLDSLQGWAGFWPGGIVHTTDGWRTWQLQPISIGGFLDDISFQDTSRGYLCGGANNIPATVYWTTNGGTNWLFDSTLTHNYEFHGIDARFQLNTALAVGEAGGIVKTTNTGSTWKVSRNGDIKNFAFLNVSLYNPNNGWASGTNGVIARTTNGGTVWNRQVSGTFNWLYGVDAPDPQKGWVCGELGTILGTQNGGNTWVAESSGTDWMTLYGIDFTDTLFGVSVGGGSRKDLYQRGKLKPWLIESQDKESTKWNNLGWYLADTLETESYGGQARGQKLTDRPYWRSVQHEAPSPQALYRIITKTTNGGATWLAKADTNQNPLYAVCFINRQEGWVSGYQGSVFHTTDGGASWTPQTSNTTAGLGSITFNPDRLHGWACGSGGTVIWTTDGGNNWNIGNSGVTQGLAGCAFVDSTHGFADAYNGLILETTDGGRTWFQDSTYIYNNLEGIFALDTTHVWAVGDLGMVMGWRQAGISGTETPAEGTRQMAVGRLEQSHPNPMKDNCAISYWLLANSQSELSIYDITGRRVRFFAPLRMTTSGRHTVGWDGKDEAGNKVPTGIYFYQLRTQGISQTKKLVKIQ